MDIQRLLDLRRITQAISRKFEADLKLHLSTLAPLFSPLQVFGEYARGGTRSVGPQAEKAYRELRSNFLSIAAKKPFFLSESLPSQLDLFSATPVLTTVEYAYTATAEETAHQITVSTPLKWVISYPESEPKRLRELLASDRNQVKEELTHVLLQSLAMEAVLAQRPGLVRLFQDLRYQISTEQVDGLGALPILTISAPLSTHLPPDDIIIQNTQLSGIPSFEEIINLDDIRQLSDPIRNDLHGIAQSLSPAIYQEITA
jgi:hypothetical protein